MAVSRRSFLRGLSGGLLSVPLLSGRGLEALAGEPDRRGRLGPSGLIRIDSNENPRGPSPRALAAIRDALAESGRYPDRTEQDLRAAIAAAHGVAEDQVLPGCGSTEHLRIAVDAFATRGSGVVTAAPSFETVARYARAHGIPVEEVPVGPDLGLDLDAMLDRSRGAGLVYVCNPNNPTGTVHGQARVEAFTRAVLDRSPATTVLVDEAYFDYVEEPSYGTLIALALADPRVVVLRTLSKVHGMAGLRVGYAIGRAETLEAMAPFRLVLGVNGLGAAGAIASLGDREHITRERRLNREARTLTRDFFERAGFAVAPSHTNFIMVAIRRPVTEFRKACETLGVAVGRPFPPLDQYARISVGTRDEMARAVRVFEAVLRT